jgi:ribosomal protein S18 acetylase RimI-like enzyme
MRAGRAAPTRLPGQTLSAASIRRLEPTEWRTYRGLRLQSVEDSPDAFGRTVDEERQRPDADWSARLASDPRHDLPLVAEINGQAVGLAWGKIDPSAPDTAHLYQMWVAPHHRGLGAGRLLLEAVIGWAATAGARYVALGVACGDTPAMRLYSRAGFEPVGEPAALRSGSLLLAQPMRLELEPRTV